MPKYYSYKIAGYYLYFTSHCTVEAMHAHASDKRLTEAGSAKFFVMKNGDTTVENKGQLNEREVNVIRKFIKMHYKEMYTLWAAMSDKGFYDKH
ncbi:MAG: DUF4160 domain-containing protein [Firmicutes bacterium]|jgi:hypothetical protein|nr:DUF4160 domain-containing protein [Bacillota bacterium]